MKNISIHPLTPERVGDYFDFFDNTAFADHQEWSWCYCTYYHFDEASEKALEDKLAKTGKDGKAGLREYAQTLMEAGTLRGYLAYADGKVIGWCNAGDRTSFRRLARETPLWDETPSPGSVLSVVCFIIAAAWRRQGVATSLLRRAVQDAKAAGYACAEAYPAHGECDCYHHYHGHSAMYAANGFAPHTATDGYTVMRLRLA